MRGTNCQPFTSRAEDIQDVTERGPSNPTCGRSGPDRPFALPTDSFEFMLDLPCPPSVNRLRKIDPVGVKARKNFYKQADQQLMEARSRSRTPLPIDKIKGPYEATIYLNDKMKIDLDNAAKITIDYLVKRRFVVNDNPKYLRRLIVQWGCPIGCRVVVRSLHEAVR